MTGFEVKVITDIDSFQFKPDLDIVLVTEHNAKPLEKIFQQQGYHWYGGHRLIAGKSCFKSVKPCLSMMIKMFLMQELNTLYLMQKLMHNETQLNLI